MNYAVTERERERERERARRKSIKLSTPIRHGVIRTRDARGRPPRNIKL